MIRKNLKKKNETEIQNIMEGYSITLEQVEDRILECEYKIEIKEKLKLLVKQIRTCERNTRTH
jgi:hypothetical protein